MLVFMQEGAVWFETDHTSQAKQKRQQRKDHLLHTPDSTTADTQSCPMCRPIFRAQIAQRQQVQNKW